jgi:hypothetical protein
MKRSLVALVLGGALLLGSVGVTGTASAQTTSLPSQSQITNFLNRALAQATTFCASRPNIAVCKRLPTEAQVTNLVNRVSTAVRNGGGQAAIRARLAPVRDQVCANSGRVLAKVPLQFRPQATQAVNRLCAV